MPAYSLYHTRRGPRIPYRSNRVAIGKWHGMLRMALPGVYYAYVDQMQDIEHSFNLGKLDTGRLGVTPRPRSLVAKIIAYDLQ